MLLCYVLIIFVIMVIKICMCCGFMIFSSSELKAQVSYSDHLLSICKLLFSTSFPEPVGQFYPDLIQIILRGREFKSIQMNSRMLLFSPRVTKSHIWYRLPMGGLIDYMYCFTSHSWIFHLSGDVTITGVGLQNLGLCLVLRAFEQGGIFIVLHLLWPGASVFPFSSEGPPHSVASYDTQRDMENLF
jgi:hypothetical protein